MPFSPISRKLTITGLMLLGGVLCCALPGITSEKTRRIASHNLVQQPIAFSHKLHSAQNLDCGFCHSTLDSGENMTIPDAEFCMTCHQTVAADKPPIKKLAQFARSHKPIPWVRVYSLPAFVFWGHRTHLAAGQSCDACHGDVASMPVVRATSVTTMDGCVSCHNQKEANTGCSTCHEGQSS
jgi:Cytochrome c7 and related cytochrome c/Class III cytochrome C family